MMCFIYRWLISSAVDERDDSRLPRRHMGRCPACREFHRRSVELGRLLTARAEGKTGASAIVPPPSVVCLGVPLPAHPQDNDNGLLGGGTNRAHNSSRRRTILWPAIGLAAAAAVVLAIVLAHGGGNKLTPQKNMVKDDPTPTPTKVAPRVTVTIDMGQIRTMAVRMGEPITQSIQGNVRHEIGLTQRQAATAANALLSYLTPPTPPKQEERQ